MSMFLFLLLASTIVPSFLNNVPYALVTADRIIKRVSAASVVSLLIELLV